MLDLWVPVIAAQGTQGSSTLTGADLWVPVIAALGAAALTGMIAFGLDWWRSKRADKSARAERRARAYSMLLARSGIIIHISSGLHLAMEVRSGLREGISTTLGIQKPLDPLELTDRLRADLQPLYEAWSEVWVVGSKEAIPEANDLVARCGAVLGAATRQGEARPEFLRRIAGEKWTQEQLDQWQEEIRGLAEARRRLGVIARREMGVEVADLFASNESKPLSKASEAQGNGATHSPETVKAQGTGNKKG